jgi:hypothetical protein
LTTVPVGARLARESNLTGAIHLNFLIEYKNTF